ncbi:hypothetical protein ABPG74_019318 [Tetrahymena malaccensis]
MDRGLCCSIHRNFPIFHISVSQNDKKKLQCVKCFSNKNMQIEFLLIQDIIQSGNNTFIENWPPLSNEQLRKDLIDLNNDIKDFNKPIEEFYDSLTKEIIKIISEKKKQQLIQAQNVYELKSFIISQYQQMAQIDKIKELIVQENQQIEKVEQDLQEQIDSQFKQQEEYTCKLSYMMNQYKLISKIDDLRAAQMKGNILESLKITNILPQNNFNYGDELDLIKLGNFDEYAQKVDEEVIINKKYQIILDDLLGQIAICNKELIQKISQKDWFLDDFLIKQQAFLMNIQINQAEFLKDIYKTTTNLQNQMAKNIQLLKSPDFKYFSEFDKLKLKDENFFIFSNYRNSIDHLKAHYFPKLLVEKIKYGQISDQFFLNFTLNPNKKYLFKINFQKKNLNSNFYVGLISVQNTQNKDLRQEGLGFDISCSKQKTQKIIEQQQRFSQISSDLEILKIYILNQNMSLSIIDKIKEQNQISDFEQEMVFTLEFRICLKDILLQYHNCQNKSKIYKADNQKQIKVDGKYHFGFQFVNGSIGDKIEIQDFQELDQFPSSN